jgi:hypothetical protein
MLSHIDSDPIHVVRGAKERARSEPPVEGAGGARPEGDAKMLCILPIRLLCSAAE